VSAATCSIGNAEIIVPSPRKSQNFRACDYVRRKINAWGIKRESEALIRQIVIIPQKVLFVNSQTMRVQGPSKPVSRVLYSDNVGVVAIYLG